MNRELIKSKIINLLKERLDNLKGSLEKKIEIIKQSPTAMESHSDTSRFQFGQLADNLQTSIEKIEKVIREIEKDKTTTECIKQGSIVQIDRDGASLYYYVSSMGLGESFLIDGMEFRVISIDTPIAKSLLGKKVNEDVEIKIPSSNYFVKIIEIN